MLAIQAPTSGVMKYSLVAYHIVPSSGNKTNSIKLQVDYYFLQLQTVRINAGKDGISRDVMHSLHHEYMFYIWWVSCIVIQGMIKVHHISLGFLRLFKDTKCTWNTFKTITSKWCLRFVLPPSSSSSFNFCLSFSAGDGDSGGHRPPVDKHTPVIDTYASLTSRWLANKPKPNVSLHNMLSRTLQNPQKWMQFHKPKHHSLPPHPLENSIHLSATHNSDLTGLCLVFLTLGWSESSRTHSRKLHKGNHNSQSGHLRLHCHQVELISQDFWYFCI